MTKNNKTKVKTEKNKEVIKAKKSKDNIKTKKGKEVIKAKKSKDNIKAINNQEKIKSSDSVKIDKKLNLDNDKLQKQVSELTEQIKEQSKQSEREVAELLKTLDNSFNEKIRKLQLDFDKRFDNLVTTQKTTTAQATKSVSKPPVNKTKVETKAPTIASLKGVGPVTQNNLAKAGFTTLKQIANPAASKIEALQLFKNIRGFDTWQDQATTLLGLN